MFKFIFTLITCLSCLNLSAQLFEASQTLIDSIDFQSYTNSMKAGDINQDGNIDFAGDDGFYINQGDNTFVFTELNIFNKIYGIEDVDNDGDMDFLDEGGVWENDGAYNFTFTSFMLDGPGVQIIVNYGDFNGDDLIDVVAVDLVAFYDDVLSIYYNQGNLAFEKTTIDMVFSNGFVDVQDFNDDDKLDIISIGDNFSEGGLIIYENDGILLNKKVYDISGPLNNDYVKLTDMDRDGDLDAVYSGSFGSLYWLENDNGNYSSSRTIATNIGITWLAVGDINEDGYPDVVALDNDNNPADIGYILNDGNGNMGSFTKFDMVDSYTQIISQWPNTLQGIIQIVDMDNDNVPDLIVNDIINDRVLFYKNLSAPSATTAPTLKDHTVYPNPFTDFMHLEFNQEQSTSTAIQIFNMNGSLISQHQTNENKILINGSHLSSGVYFYTLTNFQTNEIVGRGKLIKN